MGYGSARCGNGRASAAHLAGRLSGVNADGARAAVSLRGKHQQDSATVPPDRTAKPSHSRSGRRNRASRLFFLVS
jgi:hypothetical protein